MDIIRHRGYARAGLVGNPSDGYHGKTISISVRNFWAEAILYEWEDLELILSQEDRSRFGSVHELARDVNIHGYYGGIRLVKATIKKFVDYCRGRHSLHGRNFSIRYESNIPRQVGLAGSSAIIVATLRALMEFYDVDIPLHVQPSLALSVEKNELGIVAGLQDRVIQVYEGLVYMDFAPRGDARRGRIAVRRSTSRWIPGCCRRCTWPTARRPASRRKCCTLRCGPATSRVTRRSLAAMQKFADLTVAGPRGPAGTRRGPAERADGRELQHAAADLPAAPAPRPDGPGGPAGRGQRQVRRFGRRDPRRLSGRSDVRRTETRTGGDRLPRGQTRGPARALRRRLKSRAGRPSANPAGCSRTPRRYGQVPGALPSPGFRVATVARRRESRTLSSAATQCSAALRG